MKVNYDIQFKEIEGEKCIKINGVTFPIDENQSTIQQIANGFEQFNRFLSNDKFFFQNGTYNKAVYWPGTFNMLVEDELNFRYNVYATTHCKNRIQEYRLPQGCFTAMLYGEVVEAEYYNGNITKIITRLPNRKNQNQDICAAIMLEHNNYGHKAKVKTIWLNERNDKHKTINRENYVEKFENYA